MTASLSTTSAEVSTPPVTRAAAVWAIAAQAIALGLLVLALCWVPLPVKPDPENPENPVLIDPAVLQGVLALGAVAAALLAVACVKAWRRSAFAAALCGAALALACWLGAAKAWEYTRDIYYLDLPWLAFIVPAAAGVLTIWGLIARGGLKDQPRVGVASLLGGVLVLGIGFTFYWVFTHPPAPMERYSIESTQVLKLLAAVALYPSALWLGSTGLRRQGGLAFFPLAAAVIIAGFLVYWHR